jgi:N-acetylglutamate synthase-like GNAT family acetyltransferase
VVGAVVIERGGRATFLHGPVVTSESTPLEIAAQLVAAALDHASALGARTVFARPQSLDRVWVRFGFIPVPEGALPAVLAGRPGRGLFAWRGGSALWSLRDTEPD